MMKRVLFATMLLGVLSASAMSIHQLRTSTYAGATCGQTCDRTTTCLKPCGICFFGVNGTTGVCQPEGPAPAPTK
jgi:hypothetical protein